MMEHAHDGRACWHGKNRDEFHCRKLFGGRCWLVGGDVLVRSAMG